MEAILVSVVVWSFAAGAWLRWRFTVAVGPVVALIAGAVMVAEEEPTYDMHGIGYVVGVVVAILGLIVWGLGRWVRHITPERDG